jgi:adenine-specific DNA methylase
MIERDFDIPFIANLALREKQIQQNYRPIIAVHKWFARRPGTLFRGLLLSEFVEKPLREAFYESNDLNGIRIADPFMGGGILLIEANRVGCEVIGYDINPMAYWIVKQELEHLDLKTYSEAAQRLRASLEKEIGHLYRTRCEYCGSVDAHVKYFLWVKTHECVNCGNKFDLFPGYLVSQDRRHPKNIFICAVCGQLTETDSRKNPGNCSHCTSKLLATGPAKRNRCHCPHCGKVNHYPRTDLGAPQHRMFVLEYYCPVCKPGHKGRFFKAPDNDDLQKVRDTEQLWQKMRSRFIPEDTIPQGDETNRLHRWGYKFYHEMFNFRQKLGLEMSCRNIDKEKDDRVRNALATNLSDLLRYQNMLCRYDTMALKSLDIFSVHGFPVGLIQCESNLIGVINGNNGTSVGSGGWSNIIAKFYKAKEYCDTPFEIKHRAGRKIRVAIKDEWIGDIGNESGRIPRTVDISCADAAKREIAANSLDAVFTDPPYFGNVQYAELMDFCYVWLRKLLAKEINAFRHPSTRNTEELTGNENMGRDLAHFTQGLSSVFSKMANALKPGSPLVFTYHHNNLSAYYPIAVALLDASLTCSASLPCPAEMGASIHISNTKSSIIDTVFVSRSTGTVQRAWVPDNPRGLASVVRGDIESLMQSHMKPTRGDLRCIIFGHLTRLAIWFLRATWRKEIDTKLRLNKIEDWITEFGGLQGVEMYLDDMFGDVPEKQTMAVREREAVYGGDNDEIPF